MTPIAGFGVSICILLGSASGQTTTQPAQPQHDNQKERGPVVLTEQALEIHRAAIVIDGHNDLPWQIRKLGKSSFDVMDISQPQPRLQTDIPRLKQGGLGGQFWVVYVPPETEHDGTAAAMSLEQFDLIHRMVQRYPDVFELARTADDAERIHKSGKIASFIGIEGGHTIEGSLENLRKFHDLGARYMGLTHTLTTDWADSATDEARHGGLAPFGEKVVLAMNRIGMLVDLAHVSADTMRDALRISKAPVLVSHSCAYGVAAHARNVPDDVLQMLKTNNGLIMINFFPGYADPVGARNMADYFHVERELHEKYADPAEFKKAWKEWNDAHPTPRGNVHTIVDHIDYVAKLIGVDHVGLGSDYDGAGTMPAQLEDVSGYPYITQELLNRGYGEPDVAKILGGNLLRVLRQAEQTARSLRQQNGGNGPADRDAG
ncbi:MAG: dipeptidase [Phycisphaerae bacterium]|nr:dipeptidase [Phycisphaerae bacterium]